MTKWWIIGVGAVLGLLLVGSIALALLSEETEFAPGTPERAVQDLMRAVEGDDIEAAYAMLSQELRQKCELRNFSDGGYRYYDDDRDMRATLRDTKVIDGVTFVEVRITEFYGGAFDSGESSYNHRYALRQESGEWRFAEYPWPYDYCDEDELEPVATVTPVE